MPSDNIKPRTEDKGEKDRFIEDLIAYESGELSYKEETKFLKEVKKRNLHNKLQGHYGREIERRGI